jgi:glutathione S-transferase
MTTLRIWGRLSSINVRKVVWAARECGADFERIDAGGEFGIVRDEAYLRRNPNGLVPLLDDGGFMLWESNTIVRYLCAKFASGTLCPQSVQARADAERWMDWQQTTVNPAGRGAFLQLIRTPPEQRRAELIEQSNTAMTAVLKLLDAQLAQRPFICGEHFSMADIPLGCEVHRWFALPQPRTAWPNIERWFAALKQRPAMDGVLGATLS